MRYFLSILLVLGLVACQSKIPPKDERMVTRGHIDEALPEKTPVEKTIPPVVNQLPIVSAPKPAEKLQTFTVVATNLPASELLFALARDARLNLDIDPAIEGNVSINAIDQTLPQILKRIARQVKLRYTIDGPNLIVERDRPFSRIYSVDYLNLQRSSVSDISISTQIASTGSGGNDSGGSGGGSNSSTTITSNSANDFWKSIEENLLKIVSVDEEGGNIIINRESGTISVLATALAHDAVQSFLDTVTASVRKQVLIEATVVEVTLNDDFQAGVDWSRIASGDGWSFQQSGLAGALGTGQFLSGTYSDTGSDATVTAAVRALDEFGDVSVMSSPKIMAINNQTSILKVVDNSVYFEIEVNQNVSEGGAVNTTFETNVKTVPVGFVMNVTPFITQQDEVILNIRPTISRILGFVNDPNPQLAAAGIVSEIPEIQVREMESVLRVASGDTAVIGGLMQDSITKNSAGIPGLHEVDGFGMLFGQRQQDAAKTELVIFLRPRIIENANLEGDFQDFKRYLRPQQLSE